MLSKESRFRLNFRRGKLALAAGAVLAAGTLSLAGQAEAASGHFKVTSRLPEASPCKPDDPARFAALVKTVKGVLASGAVGKMDENIDAAVKGNGASVPVNVDIHIVPDAQSYQKLASEAAGGKLTEAGAKSDFNGNAVITRDVSKTGAKQIATVFFCNGKLRDAIDQGRLARALVQALAHAEGRAIVFASAKKGSLPAGYSTGEEAGESAAFKEHVDALLKLVPKDIAAPAAKTAEAPAAKAKNAAPEKAKDATPAKAADKAKDAAPEKAKEAAPAKAAAQAKDAAPEKAKEPVPVKVAAQAKDAAPEKAKEPAPAKAADTAKAAAPAKVAAADTAKKDTAKQLPQNQALSAKAAPAKAPAPPVGAATSIKKSDAKTASAAPSPKGPKLKAAKRKKHTVHKRKKRHTVKYRRHYHYECPFGFFW